jgi:hypothetical protein
MVRLCQEIGLPACPYQVIQDRDDFERIRTDPKTIFFIAEFEMHKNFKEQQIPFARIQRTRVKEGFKDGKHFSHKIQEYVNTHEVAGETLFLGKIAFEDLVEFCDMCKHHKRGHACNGSCYTFKSGIYWYDHDDKRRNRTLGPIVQKLFDLRKVSKGAKNTSLKLLLNSIYGKNMQLRAKYSYNCVDKNKYSDYTAKHESRIISCTQVGQTVISKEIADSFYEPNNIHIACMILEMSKRIMHEVMDVAESASIPILYTDTDSMHIVNENGALNKFSELYQTKYKRELIGTELGQFHCDFKMAGCGNEKDKDNKDILDENGKPINHWDIYATREYVVGKKVYHCVLEAKHAKTGEIKKGSVTKFKGVNTHAIKAQIEDQGGAENLFRKLIRGDEITFDMCAGDAVMFDLRQGLPFTRDVFTRVQSYGTSKPELYGCDESVLELSK